VTNWQQIAHDQRPITVDALGAGNSVNRGSRHARDFHRPVSYRDASGGLTVVSTVYGIRDALSGRLTAERAAGR
jgi:hypothetical protein